MHKQDLSLLALHTLHRPLRHGRRLQKRSRLEAHGSLRRDAEISCAILLWRRQAARCLRDVLQPRESVHGADDQEGRVLRRSTAPAARDGGLRSDKPLRARLGRDAR